MDPPRGKTPLDEDAAAPDGPGDPASVFRTNLDAFGGRASQLCALLRRGRISADACFLALTQLWIQLARSHRGVHDDPEEEEPPAG